MRNIKYIFYTCLFMVLISCNTNIQNKNEPDNNTENQVETQVDSIENISVIINDHKYDYDVASGATKEVRNTDPNPMDYNKKLEKMFWSGKPTIGYVEGDYYYTDTLFSGGYLATINLVKKDGKIQLVEFDEAAPDDYYAPEWAGKFKRLSGYGFFQAESQRTENTLVTLINGLTYLEHQILSENRLTGNFKTVKGASNSIRWAFIPALEKLSKQIEKPSGKYYYGLTKDIGNGLIARVQIIKENDKIINVKYDEIFEDNMEDIKDDKLRQFYRQSKYYSNYYSEVTGFNFKSFADEINSMVVSSQNLNSPISLIKNKNSFKEELNNYKILVNEIITKIKK